MSNPSEKISEELADLEEFTARSDEYQKEKSDKKESSKSIAPSEQVGKSAETTPEPGRYVQYALYGNGYTATTPTVNSLPPGCYDIRANTECTYVLPAANPSGILLELPEMRSEEVLRVVDTFWKSEKDYKEGNDFVVGGASFKAGVMIYGPPGSGKSCTIKLVSKKLVEMGGTVFYASVHPATVINWLSQFADVEPNRKSIVILEDFDSLVDNFGEALYLEMLDSARSIDNVLFIATTNYPERLDPRIYNRPGRFSHVIKIGLPVAKTREAYLKAILKNHRDVSEIVDKSSGFTIDHLTALVNAVYREKKDLNNEILRLRTLFRMPKSDEDRSMGIGASMGIDKEI